MIYSFSVTSMKRGTQAGGKRASKKSVTKRSGKKSTAKKGARKSTAKKGARKSRVKPSRTTVAKKGVRKTAKVAKTAPGKKRRPRKAAGANLSGAPEASTKGKASRRAAKKGARRKGVAKKAPRAAMGEESSSGATRWAYYRLPATESSSGISGYRSGHVYVTDKSGIKKKQSHTAKKATAKEIRRKLGITNKDASSVHDIIARLEERGRIPRL
jgi:hypothetical protein